MLCSPLFLSLLIPRSQPPLWPTRLAWRAQGFVLLQEDAEGKKRVVRSGSVAAKKSWASLSPIESEAIGLVWSADSLDYYLHGCPSITCVLDHCPLKTLMEAPMETLTPRMVRARSELLQYMINFEWAPGRRMSICDALGRRPVHQSWLNLPDPLESLQQDAPLQHSIYNIMGLEPYLGSRCRTASRKLSRWTPATRKY